MSHVVVVPKGCVADSEMACNAQLQREADRGRHAGGIVEIEVEVLRVDRKIIKLHLLVVGDLLDIILFHVGVVPEVIRGLDGDDLPEGAVEEVGAFEDLVVPDVVEHSDNVFNRFILRYPVFGSPDDLVVVGEIRRAVIAEHDDIEAAVGGDVGLVF